MTFRCSNIVSGRHGSRGSCGGIAVLLKRLVGTLIEGDLDVDLLNAAFKKIYEWYPVLASRFVKKEDGLIYWQPQEPVLPNFHEQLRDGKRITNGDELLRIISKTFNEFESLTSPVFSVFLYQIDRERSRACPVLRGTYSHALVIAGSHSLFDGFATVYVGTLVNNLLTDPAFPCPLVAPQAVPERWATILRDDLDPLPFSRETDVPDLSSLLWDFARPQPWRERRVEMVCSRIPAGTIARAEGVPLTDSFAVANIFCYAALALFRKPGLPTCKVRYITPAFLRPEWTRARPPERPEGLDKLFGSHTLGNSVLALVRRDTTTDELVAYIARRRREHLAGEVVRTLASVPTGNYMRREFVQDANCFGLVLSNLGRVRFPPGPITSYIGGSIGKQATDSLFVFPQGQADGSILLPIGGLTSVYPREFLLAYGDLWAEAVRHATAGSFRLADMFEWPLFVRAAALLPPPARK
eukprot:gnl/Chilomastix_cuspidata/1858.p1 GENE.gnl/Chilomastix_cuspidata/1858~~gnl/Chilomastix_cuspidata/1858.p1  ORF type:complete len:486 (+),score=185.05 gnl/Chilomastix_cuspidata/1858:54-1460(+)